MAKSLKLGTTLADLDALVLQAEAASIHSTPIGFVANIRGRLSRDERSRFWRAPGAGSWGGPHGTPLTQGEIVAAVHALRFALDRASSGGRRAKRDDLGMGASVLVRPLLDVPYRAVVADPARRRELGRKIDLRKEIIVIPGPGARHTGIHAVPRSWVVADNSPPGWRPGRRGVTGLLHESDFRREVTVLEVMDAGKDRREYVVEMRAVARLPGVREGTVLRRQVFTAKGYMDVGLRSSGAAERARALARTWIAEMPRLRASDDHAGRAARGGRRGAGIIDAAGPVSPRDYPGLFQDTNRDGIPDVDDPNPTGPPGKVSVEETRLSDELASVIDLRSRWQAALPRFKAALVEVARVQGTPQARVLARVKTPYSVVNKLLRKRLKTLTDTTGGMLIVQTAAEVRRLDAAISAGALGPVLERVDYYKTPNAGYRAIHYIVDFPGIGPAEVQLKTVRLKVVQGATHTAYKQGRLSPEGSDQLYALAVAADEGDRDAIARFGSLTQAQMTAIARGEGLAMGGRAAWHAARGRDRYGRVSIRSDDDLDKLFGEAW